MTFFANQTFSVDISKKLKYIKSDADQYNNNHGFHELILAIPKTILNFDNYLKIKFIEFDIQILNNNYEILSFLWDVLNQSNFELFYTYKIDNTEFVIKHKNLPIQILTNWTDLQNEIPKLNPLYNEIHELPHLKFRLLNDYILEQGFNSTDFTITSYLNYLYKTSYGELNTKGLSSYYYDLKLFSNFKITVNINYQNER